MKICLTCRRCAEDEDTSCADGHQNLRQVRRGSRIISQKYRLDKELGSGAMGTVYAATHLGLDRVDAVKLLQWDSILDSIRRSQPNLLSDSEEIERRRQLTFQRFRREAKSAASIKHHNVVQVFDYDVLTDDEAYIFMELIDGQTLQEYIKPVREIPLSQVVAIARQVTAGIREAHHRKVIHRDLKPANIM
ncbi:MAG TPA: serine/threonine-protein kinase, partial [Pyrinomonadaceae bacterium]|nr:serine/threonine-protein kinase [Pyrinomonadaceae bacterium]